MSTMASMKYNRADSYAPASSDQIAATNGAIAAGSTARFSTENPMLWLLGIGGVTLGLVGVSTHARVGKFSAGVNAGTV